MVALCLAAGHALAQAPAANQTSRCIDARVGTSWSYNCLNEALRVQAAQQRQGIPGISLDATSPAPAVGTFNQAAVREHLGFNFGKSAVPQRPPPPVMTSPLVR
ncbi:hypothetical protein [Acidisphaera sp. S103]|uniref:hypothetical protein n=1 Tax=Acidisphaera sp. S103 TaxID=1747223 RepID=UPI00131AA36B|nr:hypothetical protein [Acidisphaera sp. S103]